MNENEGIQSLISGVKIPEETGDGWTKSLEKGDSESRNSACFLAPIQEGRHERFWSVSGVEKHFPSRPFLAKSIVL